MARKVLLNPLFFIIVLQIICHQCGEREWWLSLRIRNGGANRSIRSRKGRRQHGFSLIMTPYILYPRNRPVSPASIVTKCWLRGTNKSGPIDRSIRGKRIQGVQPAIIGESHNNTQTRKRSYVV
jgi:hypothetical protein